MLWLYLIFHRDHCTHTRWFASGRSESRLSAADWRRGEHQRCASIAVGVGSILARDSLLLLWLCSFCCLWTVDRTHTHRDVQQTRTHAHAHMLPRSCFFAAHSIAFTEELGSFYNATHTLTLTLTFTYSHTHTHTHTHTQWASPACGGTARRATTTSW